MEAIMFYILKVCLASAVMVLGFRLLFKKERYFLFNRLYLLAALLIPWALPVVTLKLHAVSEAIPAQHSSMLEYLYAFSGTVQKEPAAQPVSLHALLFFVYAAGALFFLLQLTLSFIRIGSLTRKCSRQQLEGQEVLISQRDMVPFSFLHRIVIGGNMKDHPRLKLVLDHERVHIRQWHSLDIMLAEGFKALLWFSPFAWMLAKDLKTNLEYIADAGVTNNGRDMKAYQATLVSLVAGYTPTSLTNGFNYTQLKKRMIMMTKTFHPTKTAWKYALVLPLLAALLFTFCSKEYMYDLGDADLTVTGLVTDADGNAPLSGVTVMVKGRETGAVTNENGSYRILLSDIADTLQFVTKNGQAVSVLPAGRNKVDVTLESGSGIRIRGTGAMADVQPLIYLDGVRIDYEAMDQIDPKDIESVQVLKNSDSAVEYAGTEEARERGVVIIVTKVASSEIKGTLPESGTAMSDIRVTGYGSPEEAKAGVQDGDQGQETVRVRGYSTATGSQPVYVVDGIPYFDGLPELNPDNIESVQVLKDASAFAYMGTEEARQRGVVVIATKGLSLEPGVPALTSPKAGSQGPVLIRKAAEGAAASDEDPIIMLDGEIREGGMSGIDPETIGTVMVLTGEHAFEQVRTEEARRRGVILVTSKQIE